MSIMMNLENEAFGHLGIWTHKPFVFDFQQLLSFFLKSFQSNLKIVYCLFMSARSKNQIFRKSLQLLFLFWFWVTSTCLFLLLNWFCFETCKQGRRQGVQPFNLWRGPRPKGPQNGPPKGLKWGPERSALLTKLHKKERERKFGAPFSCNGPSWGPPAPLIDSLV